MSSGCKIVPGGYDCSKLNWDFDQPNEGIQMINDGWLMSLFFGFCVYPFWNLYEPRVYWNAGNLLYCVDDREFLTLAVEEHLRTCLKPIWKIAKHDGLFLVGTSGAFIERMMVEKYPRDTDLFIGFLVFRL